ncbi:ATP-dependent DNA ligase [Xanthomonas oryzae pv. oryzicola BLS256]|uniref:ATP-dependent DNA ligase n=1 Tax=Xanthomonas oryzae pv. oryzicola (strain BLS256) TaxID=383407 RepID=G7TCP9_XANOB|nr:ATP-dependent DNA ligase [Xanthomonas oryzae pv. oryzicola BLS256]
MPKGPSYDPKVKHMAGEVEDHPVDYASFEGEIPKGEDGGGHVAQFDHGVWATAGDPEAQLAEGHLRFELFGRKLNGGWHLVRSSKPGGSRSGCSPRRTMLTRARWKWTICWPMSLPRLRMTCPAPAPARRSARR